MRAAQTERRARLARAAGPRAGEELRDGFLADVPLPPPGAVVSAFWPMGDEIDVRPLLERLDALGYRCSLPVTVGRGKPLVFRRWSPGLALVPGGFGTSVPPEDQPLATPDLLIVPLLAFDRQGYRLGYGGGFYDRTLEALRAAGRPHLAVGVGYAGQEVARVPHHEGDQRLDWVVTERDAFRAAGA
ncbi:MAG: 5-formyltetrahydrofolate cyclo-ligase [Alphaproteobacteria bacterium]|nr:5-formyltetrahydrofolate cyclo-ligase [Alphaproteobacteria bacterium]